MKSAVLSTFMWGLFLLGAHENNGLQVINADYFVYNELTDTTTSKIGYSLDQSDGLLAYSQENRATVSDDNLYETGVQWHEYKVQDAFPDSGDADVISRIHYPYVLLGSKAGVSLLKYTSRTFSGASDVSFSSFSNFEADAFAMSTSFFAVSGKLMAGTSIWGRRLLIFELDSADGSWKIGFNHSITGDKYAASLATLSDTMLAYGVTSEKIVLLKKTSPSFNAGWSIAATILSPTGLDTGTSGIGGFGAVLDYSDGILVVGGPSVNVDTLTGSHHGKVFVYNITNFNDPRGPFTLEPDSKLADFADHSETGSSVGIQFGESFFVSKRLTSVATESIMLGVGAPGANGVVIYYLEKDMSGRRLFNVVNVVFVQGFRLKLDHDTGDAVSWDAIGERMFLGAPLADNFDIYGSQQQYGVIGRLYVSTVCPPNKYRHSPSVYSYVKVCKLWNYSTWVSTVMGAPLKPGKPVPPHIVSATCSSMNISLSALSFETDGGESPSKYRVMVLSKELGSRTLVRMTDTEPVPILKIIKLSSGSTYAFAVAAINSAGVSIFSLDSTSGLTVAPPCLPEPPQRPNISHVEPDSIKACLTRPRNDGGAMIKNYSIFVDRLFEGRSIEVRRITINAEDSLALRESTSSVICTDVGRLNGSTKYAFRARATTLAGVSPLSLSSPSRTTLSPILPHWDSTDSLFQLACNQGGTLKFRWPILKSNGGAPVLDYRIYWREKNETKWHGNQFSFEAATMEGRVYGLRANTLYSVRLVAINVVGESNPGVLGLFSTGNASVADPPQGISTLAIGSSTLQFTWSAVSLSGRGGSNINGFYAYLSSADDSARNRSSPLLTAPPARFTHLHGGHQYLLYMLTVSNNMKLLGPISAPVIFTTTAPRTPVVPTSVECDTSRVTASTLRLSWPVSVDNGGRPITNVIVYSVKFWDIHGNRVVKKVPSVDLSGVTETSAVVHGLYADSNYSFFIQVFNEIGGSENSTESNTVLTSSQSHPSPPRTLKVSKRTGGSISFVDLLPQNLGGASRANSFVLIKYSAVMSGGEGVGSTGPSTYVATKKGQDSFELVGLSPLTTYHFLATTVAEGGLVEAMIRFSDQPGQFLSALSTSFINGTTTASVPGRSPAVVVLEISHHSFRVSIRPPEDTGGLPLTSRTLSISSKGRVLGQMEDIPPILNEQTLTLHGLLGNTKYCVTLLSTNEIGISRSTSEPVIIETPDATLPSLPQNVRIARRSEGGLKITWLSPESNGGASITHYGLSLKVSPQESDWTNISVPSLPLEYKNDTFVRLPVVKHSYHWDTALSDGFNFVASVRAVSRISSTSDTSNVSSVTVHFSSSTSALMKPASIACSHSLDSHSATCTWTRSLDARETGYDITLRLGSLVVFTGETVAGSTLSITFDRLRANSSYTMQVFSTKKLNSESSEYPAEVTFVTALKAIPSSPLNFQLLDMLSSAVSFGWSDPASWGGGSHLRFLIECSTHGNSAGLWTSVSTYDLGFDEVEKSTSLRAGPSNYTMKVANLLNNTQYFFRITAQNEIGDSTQKLTSSGLTTLSTTADNCLTGIRPVAVDFGSVSFIWNTPLVAFSHSNILYRVHCDGSDGSHHVKVAAQNFTVVNNLMPQTFYSCRVVLVLNGVSGTCNRWTSPIMTRVETVPDQIATVNISAVIRSSYLVTHFVPPPMVNNLQNMFYRVKLFECHDDRMTVCRSAPCSDPTTSFIFEANFTSPDANVLVTLEVPGILAKKIYRVSVAARNYIPQYGLDSGCSEPFEIGHGEVPSRPQSLLVEEIRNSSVQLSWSPPKYIGGGDNVIYLFECWKPSHPSAGHRHGECIQCTGYRVISLLGSSQYTCRVYAKTAFGMSPNSNAVIFNTGRPTKPGKPESAPSIADVKRPDAFSLSWNLDNIDSGGSPIQLFHIYLGVGDAEEHSALILIANTSSSQCTITGLSANTSYVTMFSGVNSLGEGPLSDAAVVTTTRATTPSSASNIEVAVRSNDEGMYELKWDHASMTGGLPVSYKIFRSSYSKFSPCDSDGIAGSFPHNSQNLWKNGMICPSRSNTLCNSGIISTVAYELESSLEFVGETPSNSFGPTAISEGRIVLFTNWLPLGEGTDASGSMALTKQLYTFSGLDMNEEYIFGVRAKSSSGAGIWQYVNARTSARVPCPNGTPKALCDRGTKLSIPCSCHGICHAWDGTCSCDGGWKGANCNIPDGVHMTLYLKGPNVDNEWSDYEKTRFCEALAKAANIDANRVPMEYVVMHVEHSRMRRLNTRVSKVSFVILNPLQKSGAILNEPRASKVQESIEKSILEGEFSAFAILSFVSSDGKQMSAPALPKCSYVDADSCVPCVAQRGCGWCDTGPKWCSQGDANGPAFLLSVSCPASNWRYATSEMCAPTSVAICSAHASCSPCLKEAAASCGWCAETATCIPRSKEKNMCSNWGFTDAVCVGTCTKQKFETDMTGFIWMGDDHRGSELFYQANKHCKWHVGPGQDPDPTKYVEVGKVNFVLDRADIGRGDRLTVYDGKSQSSDGILIDINGNSMTESSFPIDVTVDSSLIIVEFSSDMSPQTVGTGFLATYKGHPRSFWDSYILLSLSSVIMLALCCCLCYKCSVLPNDMEGRQVENSFGLDLEATANGASLENIKKFPTFVFSDEHKMKMEKLEQELACSICLGDYENEEELRLLPCGHMFHTPCIDAWLQINRICPLCKADVYVLAEQRRRGKKKDKRKKFMDKVLRRRRIDVSPMNPGGGRGFTERQEELLTIP
eukprot:Stramenopile-MAST_4_protein_390